MSSVQVSEVLFGILLLALGKKLFWLFVGIMGFMAGMDLAPKLFPGYSELIIFTLALTLGVAGAVSAVMFQWAAVLTAGFLGGGYLLINFFPLNSFAPFIIGGIIGALLMAVAFDWALLILSSLVGAALISRNFFFSDTARTFIFIALAAVGIMIQSALFLGRSKD